MHLVRATDGFGADFGQADVPDVTGAAPYRRWPRSCPRSAPRDRAAPGDRCRCNRCRAAAACRSGTFLTAAGRRVVAEPAPAGSRSAPNFTEIMHLERGTPSSAAADQHLVVAHAVEVAGVDQRDAGSIAARIVAMPRPRRPARTPRATCPCSRARSRTPRPGEPSMRLGRLLRWSWLHRCSCFRTGTAAVRWRNERPQHEAKAIISDFRHNAVTAASHEYSGTAPDLMRSGQARSGPLAQCRTANRSASR